MLFIMSINFRMGPLNRLKRSPSPSLRSQSLFLFTPPQSSPSSPVLLLLLLLGSQPENQEFSRARGKRRGFNKRSGGGKKEK